MEVLFPLTPPGIRVGDKSYLSLKEVNEDFYRFNVKLEHLFPLKLLSINHFLIISLNYQLSVSERSLE